MISKSAVKKYVLEKARERFGDKMTRVGSDVYPYVEAAVRTCIEQLVLDHPTVGKTINTGKAKFLDDRT